jgi:hypothetical protein
VQTPAPQMPSNSEKAAAKPAAGTPGSASQAVKERHAIIVKGIRYEKLAVAGEGASSHVRVRIALQCCRRCTHAGLQHAAATILLVVLLSVFRREA